MTLFDPHWPETPPGATTTPAGNESVKPIPVKETLFEAGFAIVKLNVTVPFNAIVAGANAFVITAGVATARLADAVEPVPPSFEETLPVVLVFVPAVVPVTVTVTSQEALAASVPPDKAILPDPAGAVNVPPQVFAAPLGVPITRPAGSESVNAIPLSGLAFGFDRLTVSVVEPFSGIALAPKAFVIAGGPITVRVAVEVLPVPALPEMTVTLFVFTPLVVPVTFTVNEQAVTERRLARLVPGSVAPIRVTEPDPAAAVIVPPPHAPVSPFGVETTRPAGKRSVNPTPVKAVEFTAGLEMVNDSAVDPFSGIV
jgi:hypothetical protein